MLLLMLCAYAGAIYAIFFKLGWLRWTLPWRATTIRPADCRTGAVDDLVSSGCARRCAGRRNSAPISPLMWSRSSR